MNCAYFTRIACCCKKFHYAALTLAPPDAYEGGVARWYGFLMIPVSSSSSQGALLRIAAFTTLIVLAGCSTSRAPQPDVPLPLPAAPPSAADSRYITLTETQINELVLRSFSLLGLGYTFGGKNPDAGLDCSGMVSYIVEQVSGHPLPYNAAQIAARTRPVERTKLRAGDLVFFNTTGRAHSHMGIYLGDNQFIHASSGSRRIRPARLDNTYFRKRLDGLRRLSAG